MPLEEPSPDDFSRFQTLRDESLTLLAAARSLVSEMRSSLDDCRRHRPAVVPSPSAGGEEPPPPAVRSHRGGRVMRAKRTKRLRRPK